MIQRLRKNVHCNIYNHNVTKKQNRPNVVGRRLGGFLKKTVYYLIITIKTNQNWLFCQLFLSIGNIQSLGWVGHTTPLQVVDLILLAVRMTN